MPDNLAFPNRMKNKSWSRLRVMSHFKHRTHVFPAYQDKSGMVSPRRRSRFLDLDPSLVLSPAEHAEVRRLLQKKHALGSDFETRQSEPWKELGQRIEQVAGGALLRHLGVEMYMVLDVERDDGFQKRLQVLHIDLQARWAGGPLRWSLHGRALRKNQTLGTLSESTSFDSARILRRTLEGIWIPLTPRPRRHTRQRHAV